METVSQFCSYVSFTTPLLDMSDKMRWKTLVSGRLVLLDPCMSCRHDRSRENTSSRTWTTSRKFQVCIRSVICPETCDVMERVAQTTDSGMSV